MKNASRLASLCWSATAALCWACGQTAAPASRAPDEPEREQVTPSTPSPQAEEDEQATTSDAPGEPARGDDKPATAPASAPQVLVDDVRLSLKGCDVSIEGASPTLLSLPMSGDCEFAHVGDAVQVEQTPQGKTVLVVSSRPLAGRPGDCDTRVRALVVRSGQVRVSKDEQAIRMCGAEGPFDEPTFIVLATSVAMSP